MAQDYSRAEVGFSIASDGSTDDFIIEYGTVAPGDGAGTDRPQGSIQHVLEGGTGKVYFKEGVADTAWEQIASQTYVDNAVSGVVSGTRWRPENPVVAATGDAAPAEGASTASFTPFTDDDGAGVTLAENDYVIFGVGGTGVVGRVYDDSGLKITFLGTAVEAAAAGDLFLVDAWLPDASGQENQAIGLFTTATNVIKFQDIDFGLTTGITVATPFTPGSGDPTAGDTLHVVLQKLDGNDDAMLQVLGVSQGDTNLGAFTASSGAAEIIGATSSVKAALQLLGDEIGTAVVAGVRTNNPVSDQAVNRNIEALDAAIGINSQLTVQTRTVGALTVNSTVMSKFNQLDAAIGADSDLTPLARTTGAVALSNNVYSNIDQLDAAIGVDVAPQTRTNNPTVASNTSNANISALDAAIGADAQITSTNWISTNNSAYELANLLDDGIGKLINEFEVTGLPVASNTVLMTIPVGEVGTVKFFVEGRSGTNRSAYEVYATHNGTTADNNSNSQLRIGSRVLRDFSVDISGGNLRLIANVLQASTDVRITYVRTPVP